MEISFNLFYLGKKYTVQATFCTPVMLQISIWDCLW